tara:strand:+ start:3192 stop:4286 length:1095 start_codon:yes stop_codon:yes gene_type:complete
MDNLIFVAFFGLIGLCLLVIWRMSVSIKRYKKLGASSAKGPGERTFESLVENGLDCVIIVSPEGTTTYVSRSIKNILGYSPDEVLNVDFRDLVHPDDLEGAEEVFARTILNPGIPIQGHTSRVKHKNGSWRWIEAVVTNLIDDPAINGIVDNFRDVTERIKVQSELREVNERFHLATKGSKLGIWDQDLENDILIWDEDMYRIYQVSDPTFELTSNTWLELIHEEDREFLQEQVKKILVDGGELDIEYRIVRPDSTIRNIRSLAHIYFNGKGRPVRMVGTNLDITDSKEYEQTLECIIFDISHVIRKPVSSILGLCSLIENDQLEQKELLRISAYIKEAAKELDDYTTDLIDTYTEQKLARKGR